MADKLTKWRINQKENPTTAVSSSVWQVACSVTVASPPSPHKPPASPPPTHFRCGEQLLQKTENMTNRDHWKVYEDGNSVNSINKELIPWLDLSLATWFEIEDHQSWYTDFQFTAFNNFLALTNETKNNFIKELESIYIKSINDKRIEKTEAQDILNSIDWEKSHICVPQLYSSKNEYIIMLPETKWKLTESDFMLELEILFTNGKVELVQEMSGLWNRIEWFEDYVKRKKQYMINLLK